MVDLWPSDTNERKVPFVFAWGKNNQTPFCFVNFDGMKLKIERERVNEHMGGKTKSTCQILIAEEKRKNPKGKS